MSTASQLYNSTKQNNSSNTSNSNEHTYSEDYYSAHQEDYEVQEDYVIRIGSDTFSAVQVRNAISKAVRDAVYGNTGLMTMLNDGKKLKIKIGL